MPDLLIRNVSAEAVEQLKQRAERNGRSLQAEALETIERAAKPSGAELVAWLKTVRPKHLTEDEVEAMIDFATKAIREDRDER